MTRALSRTPGGAARTALALALAAAALAAPPTAGAQVCDGPPSAGPGPSRDLYCMTLVPDPVRGLEAASGRVELGRIPGPFTVTVTADGRPVYAPIATIAGLPHPATLGPYTTYVAWAAPSTMYPVHKLGIVTNGRTTLHPVDIDPFIFLVTAESSAASREPAGREVLRGGSPSTRLQPPDLFQFSIGATRQSPAADSASAGSSMPAMAGMSPAASSGASSGSRGGSSIAWSSVPMLPGIQMLPAEMLLRPAVPPYLPAAHGPLPTRRPHRIVQLADGDTLHLTAGLIRRTIAGHAVTMYAFNDQQPGPLISVPQGAEIVVDFQNRLDQPSSVHWHGVRLDNRFDGVPGLTQEAVPPGGHFTYRVRFPDAGIYWYHPHVREDIQQDLGLYGNILVRRPPARSARADAYREQVLILDDLLVSDDGLVPYGADGATHALMGRFGNVMLVNGEPRYRMTVHRGDVVQFYLTNVANTRPFNLSFPGARMKVVGSDAGNFVHEEWVPSVVIAPAERYVVQVRFDRPGSVSLLNRVRGLDHLFGHFVPLVDTLGTVRVLPAPARASARRFDVLHRDTAAAVEIARFRPQLDRPVDRTLVLTLDTQGLPFVSRQLMLLDSVYFAPVEWGGTMPNMNWASTSRQVRWVLRDPSTGRENMDIGWTFRRGDVIKLRLVNERQTLHGMQHPIHIHGQRFLVTAVNGVPNENLVWKDTVLVPAGSAVDLLVDLSNPGRWMLHCHIAEHLTAQMMTMFTVQ